MACATVFFEHAGVKGNGNMGSGFSRRLLAPLLSPGPILTTRASPSSPAFG